MTPDRTVSTEPDPSRLQAARDAEDQAYRELKAAMDSGQTDLAVIMPLMAAATASHDVKLRVIASGAARDTRRT